MTTSYRDAWLAHLATDLPLPSAFHIWHQLNEGRQPTLDVDFDGLAIEPHQDATTRLELINEVFLCKNVGLLQDDVLSRRWLEKVIQDHDGLLREFIRCFQVRLLEHEYELIAKCCWPEMNALPINGYADAILNTLGLPFANRSLFPLIFRWVSFIRDDRPSIGALEAILSDVVNVVVRVTATSASSVPDGRLPSFRIVCGPLKWREYLALLPSATFDNDDAWTKPSFDLLLAITWLYAGIDAKFDIALILQSGEDRSTVYHQPCWKWTFWPGVPDKCDRELTGHISNAFINAYPLTSARRPVR